MIWVKYELVVAVQEWQRTLHGGLSGLADPGTLEAALARPAQLYAYEQAGVWELAACYAEAIVQAHAFNDANKRTAFVVTATFLEINGYRLDASQLEIVQTMLAVANHEITRTELAQWLQRNSCPMQIPSSTLSRG